MIDANEFIKKLNTLKLSAEHYCFAHFLLLNKEEQHKKNKVFNYDFGTYWNINKNFHNYKKLIDDLEEKGYIVNNNTTDDYSIDKIIVTKLFKEVVFVESEEAWQEVLQTYPRWMIIDKNGKKTQIPANTQDAFLKKQYYDQITKGGNKALHDYFILSVENFYKGAKVIESGGVGLKKFIDSWESMKILIQEAIIDDDNVVHKKIIR